MKTSAAGLTVIGAIYIVVISNIIISDSFMLVIQAYSKSVLLILLVIFIGIATMVGITIGSRSAYEKVMKMFDDGEEGKDA